MMKAMKLWMVVAVLGVVCGSARAASFDCKLAKTAEEKVICSTPELSALDDMMSSAYKAWAAVAPPDMKAEVLADQRAWIARQAWTCKSMDKPEMPECLKLGYQDRIAELKADATTMGGVSFVNHTIRLTIKDGSGDADGTPTEQIKGFGILTATWPMALSAAPEWLKFNDAVATEVKKLAATNPLAPHLATDTWRSAWAKGADTDMTSAVTEVGQNRVSVRFDMIYFGHGAAHVDRTFENFHWLLVPGRLMAVTDMFKPGSGWAAVVNARCKVAINKQMGDAPPVDDFDKQLAAVTNDPNNWALTKDGLKISFPEYSVSAFAFPADDVTVPWSELKAFFAAGFVPPQ